ncbi:hypothetical protein DNHGIG_40730 [Collibacillus ludicampi]|uniref:ParB-like N-terminal domain-containing protein n=1 Tax=Collibacillus ludicampi TaxID=2771369 RepID=A0AAV4LKY7_9BACL|nr:ParB/RepB/Spo0J family partition protein [Collibacillus ludicampi]GIM48524.1 hypothetical protein DNHGIG_40730 [Collibacillus ludicampi]
MRINERIEYRFVDDLEPHPRNHEFHSEHDEDTYALLKRSIEADGIQEPLWITPDDVIVSGETRWRIAKELGMEEVPVRIIEDATETDILYLLISANETRRGDEKDLMKKARKLKVLHEYWMNHQSQIGTLEQAGLVKMAGSRSAFYRLLKLNSLIPELQELVSQGVIGQQAGHELASLSPEDQKAMYESIRSKGVTKVRLDEVQAIREELDKFDRVTLASIVPRDKEQSSEGDEEGTEENATADRLQTIEAVAPVLPEQASKIVKQRIFNKRASYFQKRLNAFMEDIHLLAEIDELEDETKNTLETLLESLRKIECDLTNRLYPDSRLLVAPSAES